MPKPDFTIDLTESFEHLDSSPIVEAVIQWGARAGNALNETALSEALQRRLPEYPHVHSQRYQQMRALLRPGVSLSSQIDEGWHGLRLTSEDKLFVLQCTIEGMVFSRLAPYHNWEDFSQAALQVWDLYREIAQPTEVQRLGVRFINRIPLKKVEQVGKYLRQAPKCLSGMNLPAANFIYQSTHRVPDRPYGICVTRTVPPAESLPDRALSLVVDLDAFTCESFGTATEDSQEHLRHLRWLKDKAFFSLLTKNALTEFARKRASP